MDKRAVILVTAVACAFALVVVRLADLMLVKHKRLGDIAAGQYEGKLSVPVYRGGIFDRRGRELAVNVDSESAFFNPSEVAHPGATALAVSEIMETDAPRLAQRLDSDRSFIWGKRKLPADEARRLRERGLEGLGFVTEVKRYYPKGRLASHVLGFVGIDNQALGGVELKYDDVLSVEATRVSYARDAAGRALSGGMEFERLGGSIVLTIDEGLQFITEKALERGVREWEAASASAIMMNPSTGEILAMANYPTYDPNAPGASTTEAKRNRAITDTFEPGSTFKLVMAAAALETGAVTQSSIVDCSAGSVRIGRRTIRDVHKKGILTFKEVIQHSSNVGTIQVAERLGPDLMAEFSTRFGFGARTGIDLPAESRGAFDPSTRSWGRTDYLSASIGYGIGATPLQILRAYAAVANGGLLVRPHVVREVVAPDGATLYRVSPDGGGGLERAISPEVAETLREILASVTDVDGTAAGASVEGNRVAGKTGTARLFDPGTGTYSTDRYASSFVGFVPAERPKIAIIVVLFDPRGKYYGGDVAAPVFREIASRALAYLNVPRDDMFRENILVVRGPREIG
jgi:cell division protein FtsI (penicillin-binding protein 3)